MNPTGINSELSSDSDDAPEVSGAALKELTAPPKGLNRRDDFFYEDLTRTNNELANLEREMVRSNFELAAAQKNLLISEQRYRNLSACSPIGILEMGASESCLYANPHWGVMTGLTIEQSLGNGWQHAIDHRDCAAFLEEWNEARAAGGEFCRELRLITTSGAERWAQVRARAIRSGTGEISGTVTTVEDITERKNADAALEKAHKQLLEVSRQAGMAEVAAGVLHNVGNVLNSVNISSTCLADNLRKSKAGNLSKVVALLREHQIDLGSFLKDDPKGKQLPGYLAQLAGHLEGERSSALKELGELQSNIDHIKVIVARHQDYARVSGVAETFQISDVIEEALRMNASVLTEHEVQVIREFAEVSSIRTEKHKVLHVLVSLIRNAARGCEESGRTGKQVRVRLINSDHAVRISVSDNGAGIPAENLTRIFNQGFTTPKGGHGHALHDCANAAKELGGSLTVHSGGIGCGATFTLELPYLCVGNLT